MNRGGWLTLLAVVLSLSSLMMLSGCGGSASSSNPPPTPSPTPAANSAPTIQFSADKTSIITGQTVVLTWNSSNATGVTIQPDGPAGLGPAGTLKVTPTATTTYTATASGAGGTATATMTVTVTPPAPPTVTLTASPATVNAGQFSTLTWTTTGANSVNVDPKIPTADNQPLALSGNAAVVPTATTNYTITATGPGGTATAKATVTVIQPVPTITLTVTPTTTIAGTAATLAWTSQNATSISIDNGIGDVAVPSGNKSVTPNSTTTFTATATGLGGTAKASATLTVQQQLAVTLTATPLTVGTGQSTTLAWTSQLATSVRIDPQPGPVNSLSGSASVTPTATTTYTATATDATGKTKTAQVTVAVLPPGALTSIKHIIFFVQENRSFDHYLGNLGRYKASKGLTNDVDGLPLDAAQKDQNGALVHPYHLQTTCVQNTSPSWNPSWAAWDNGKMDGFVLAHDIPSTIDPQYHRAMGYYDQTDLPYLYELGAQFATSDRFFEPVMAATIPNRMYMFAGTSFGHIFSEDQPPVSGWLQKTIFELLTEHNITWRYYFQDNSIFLSQWAAWNNPAIRNNTNIANISEWYKTLADPNADTLLPQVIFIERATENQNPATGELCSNAPSSTCTSLDEHPDAHTQAGAARAAQIINALLDSAAWKSSVFILTYDEFGGQFDHVPIQSAPAPDSIAPMATVEQILPGDFAHTGFRIPVVVISPWVKPSFVSHKATDATAILKFIETRFGVPSLTPRDAAASDMQDFFDFSAPARLNAPNGQPWTKFLPSQPTDEVCDFNLEIQGQK